MKHDESLGPLSGYQCFRKDFPVVLTTWIHYSRLVTYNHTGQCRQTKVRIHTSHGNCLAVMCSAHLWFPRKLWRRIHQNRYIYIYIHTKTLRERVHTHMPIFSSLFLNNCSGGSSFNDSSFHALMQAHTAQASVRNPLLSRILPESKKDQCIKL